METVRLYHGSTSIIMNPTYGGGKISNDYGQGFYCTENIELAKEWACSNNQDGFANCYKMDFTGLLVTDLSSNNYHILNWLALLMQNRKVNLSGPNAARAKEYLIDNFLPDVALADVIIGYRADDSYFSFARDFINNAISVRQLAAAMRLGKLGEQVVLKSEKAFTQISYYGYETADRAIYFQRRKQRDDAARAAYLQTDETADMNGLYMLDIMRGGIRNDDPQLPRNVSWGCNG